MSDHDGMPMIRSKVKVMELQKLPKWPKRPIVGYDTPRPYVNFVWSDF